MKYLYFILFVSIFCATHAQYPPAAGQEGSTAVHYSDSRFIAWSQSCVVERGYVNIADTNVYVAASNRASYGLDADACGYYDSKVVSLGDKGVATLIFTPPIVNGDGFDFAVFENGLSDNFLELAFVEVSSDGLNFFRFPAVSLTQTESQTTSFGLTDPVKIHNLAGKYKSEYGTPFDIAEIPDNPLLDKNHITYVKVIDVCGSISPEFASFDSEEHIINDPFPTPFTSSGFDLEAIGAFYNVSSVQEKEHNRISLCIYPQPAQSDVYIKSNLVFTEYTVYSSSQNFIFSDIISGKCIKLDTLPSGTYILQLQDESEQKYFRKLLIIR